MSIHSTSRAGISKAKWAKRFQELSASSASFGGDFSALVYASPVASDTRMPFQEPDPRVFLLPPAAVPSRPTYDVFGDEPKVAVTHGSVVAAATFSTVGAIAGLLSALVGAFALGYQQGLHHKAHR